MRISLSDQYQRGIPMKDREETINAINSLLGNNINSHTNVSSTGGNSNNNVNIEGSYNATYNSNTDISSVYGEGPIILSDIPKSCHQRPIILGIDEAGRGSVIGPMIYGMCYWDANAMIDDDDTNRSTTSSSEKTMNLLPKIPKDFNDSKQLNEKQRDKLFDTILHSNDIGFGIRIFPSSEISRNMLRPMTPYNLNQMSHNGTITLIRSLQQQQHHVQTCYIDTVGNAVSYQYRLEQEFPGIEFIVESKADDTYPVCSAASIGMCVFLCIYIYQFIIMLARHVYIFILY
jgi:ribonuclease HII